MRKVKKYIKQEKLVILLGVLIIVLLVVGAFLFLKSDDSQSKTVLEFSKESNSVVTSESSSAIKSDSKMYVDIKGAVVKPGMYEVTPEMRILNVIELSGGLLKEADDKQINFSQRIEDQMVIYIPKEGEEIAELQNTVAVNGTNDKSTKSEEGKINLNQASKEELMTLNGIGEKKAEKIIEHREENGSFESIEDLKKVNGFGEKTFESLRESITI
ncbi:MULTISPECIES: helix-hairpin-helix domain-containing protein [Vagococcus]|uniref:Late competence protein ComEA, DNA receptor n=1 Tax=Vagococcus fluvialis bH819 TaxID=1255619 RepID=A0A1X6WQZ7_9ENTE|nr:MULTISPECIES: helix-hairpin-helix domain-containing protein [Vagococcus]SLM86695.1 Late competence protein ComEA, DNA receptor [Vagococcus fluvialis bH819]HCM90903.1 comEA protein [Vagococcus sp.]